MAIEPQIKWLKDGDSVEATSHFYFTCCDCGKRHFLGIDRITPDGKITNRDKLAIRIYGDRNMERLYRKIKDWKCRPR